MRALPVRARGILAAGLSAAVISVPLIGTAAAAGSATSATSASQAVSDRAAAGHATDTAGSRPLPQQLFAPYFETWTKNSIPAVATKSGARYFTLAFLQTPRKGSCTVAWNGDRKQVVRPGGRYVHGIARLRAMGGNVIPSFGGFSADQDGTEIADSCTSVRKIAKAYENVVTAYGVTRLDMDVEARSLNRPAAITRRSEAIRLLQEWAARTHRTVQVIFTLGVEPSGLPGNCLAVLKNAVAHAVAVTAVNLMAFDYYNSKTDSDMGTEALEALHAAHRQLARLYPGASSQQLWGMEGVTLLPGIDDFPKKTEVTYLSEVQDIQYFARAHRLPMISIWAIQRDNGRCPGTIDSNSCSGITQPKWAFSHLLAGYSVR
jgi:Glycosyl hydrolases family 18